MKEVLKHLGLFFMAVLITFAAGGINLYKHYCLCTNQAMQSFFVNDDLCDHQQKHHCCEMPDAQEKQSCCNNNDISHQKEDGQSDKDHNCCNDEYYFFKTDQFDYSKSPKQSFEFIAAFQQILQSDTENSNTYNFQFFQYPKEIPPPQYGIRLLHALHQLKISLPVA